MNKLSLNSIDQSVFRVAARDTENNDQRRADIVSAGRLLFFEHARRGAKAIRAAASEPDTLGKEKLTEQGYGQLNKWFREEHLLYASARACAVTGKTAPEDFNALRGQGMDLWKDPVFLRTLASIWQEIITPILPTVYSEAVGMFADVVQVGLMETYEISVGSDDIVFFQDSAWGSARSVPANRFYTRDITLNPTPKTAEIRAKWTQIVGNNQDFGAFFANLVAGMYAKTTAMWNAALTQAAQGSVYIPAGLTYTFSSQNWSLAANKVSAVNGTRIRNIFATGSIPALAKVLPTQATGSTNLSMDAALATLLGAEYNASGYLGEFMGVSLRPLMDAIVPGTQYTTVDTILSQNDVWMMAGNGRRPLTIAYTADTPITISIDPERTASFEYIVNLTAALESAAVFSSRMAHITV